MATPKQKKPTREETTRLKTQFVRTLINEGRYSRGEIKRLFAKQFGCSPRSAERFISKAYQQIREESGRDTAEHRVEAYAFWTAVASGKITVNGATVAVGLRERMRAQENLDRITGVHAPTKQAVTDAAGQDVAPPARMTLRELDAALDKIAGELQPPTAPEPESA